MAQAEAAARQQQQVQYIPITNTQPAPKKKRKTWLWVLGWILVFPIPLTIILLRKKDLNPKIRYGAIAAAWIIYLAIGMSGNGEGSSNKTEDTSSKVTASQEAESENEGKGSAQDESSSSSSQSEAPVGDSSNTTQSITLVAGEDNEYSKRITFNKGTEFEETVVAFYVPSGTYEVENIGNKPNQVNVYEGKTVNEDGWEEVANIADGTPVLLGPGDKTTITVPEGYYVDIYEPAQIRLTPID